MQNCLSLLIVDVLPIYIIMPRYSHNYALFYELLDCNLFTHRNTSPDRHLDLLRCIIASRSSRQLLLLPLSLMHSDKVKQLHGACTSYNKETTLRVLPVVDITKHAHLIHQHISHHLLTISHHNMLQKQA